MQDYILIRPTAAYAEQIAQYRQRKNILANGSVYESTVLEPNENVRLKRFWITQ